MAIDLIKEYLVGIGFQVDSSSFDNAKSSMGEAENTIKKFNKSSQNGFSETNESLQGLFKLIMASNGNLLKLFPELRTPLKGLIGDITILKKLYGDIANVKVKPNSEDTKSKEKNKTSSNIFTDFKNNNFKDKSKSNVKSKELAITPKDNKLIEGSKNLIDGILDAKEASNSLAVEGGNAFKLFSSEALGPIALVIAGVVAFTLATKAVIGTLNDLAKQDIAYEKLSRQLWTTKENAKEVDMALKTLGVSMQDLWLSPTLLKQFNELRKDSADLKLPKEYTENLKIVQGIGFEFARLRQIGQLTLQWIANYILQYASGPLNDIRQGFREFNNWLKENAPGIGKVIGTVLGVILQLITTLGEAIGGIIILFSKGIGVISDLFGMLPEPLKNITKLIAAIGLIIMAGPVGAIIALIAALDDLFTYLKGGKSVIGGFFEELFGGKKSKNTISNVGSKVQEFNKANANSVPQSYTTTNNNSTNSSTKQNSDNTISNTNTFHVYGGSDANSTANTISNKVNGVTIRNLQGVT